MSRIFIGIDPGVSTGYALWEDDKLYVDTGTFWSVVGTLEQFGRDARPEGTEIVVVIEDPNLNRPVFPRGVNPAMMLKVAQNVGANKRDAQLLIEWAESWELEVRRVRPVSKKWDAETFQKITGYNGRTSQHARDAAKLVYGL